MKPNVKVALFTIWVIIFHSSVFAISISFFYRYLKLCLNRHFPRRLHVGCLLLLGFFAITYGLHSCYTYCIRTKNYLSTAETLKELFGDKNGNVLATGISGTVS